RNRHHAVWSVRYLGGENGPYQSWHRHHAGGGVPPWNTLDFLRADQICDFAPASEGRRSVGRYWLGRGWNLSVDPAGNGYCRLGDGRNGWIPDDYDCCDRLVYRTDRAAGTPRGA